MHKVVYAFLILSFTSFAGASEKEDPQGVSLKSLPAVAGPAETPVQDSPVQGAEGVGSAANPEIANGKIVALFRAVLTLFDIELSPEEARLFELSCASLPAAPVDINSGKYKPLRDKLNGSPALKMMALWAKTPEIKILFKRLPLFIQRIPRPLHPDLEAFSAIFDRMAEGNPADSVLQNSVIPQRQRCTYLIAYLPAILTLAAAVLAPPLMYMSNALYMRIYHPYG